MLLMRTAFTDTRFLVGLFALLSSALAASPALSAAMSATMDKRTSTTREHVEPARVHGSHRTQCYTAM